MLHDGIDKEVFFINKTFGKLLVIRYYPSFPRKWLTIKMPKDKQNTMTTPNNNACCLLSAAFIEHMWFKSAFAIKKLLPTLAPRRTSLQYVRNFVNCRLKKGNVHSHIGYRMFLHSYLGSTWAVSPCHHTILRETCAELIERSSRTAVARPPASTCASIDSRSVWMSHSTGWSKTAHKCIHTRGFTPSVGDEDGSNSSYHWHTELIQEWQH